MKKILFVPMNWGLGHATRCAELIHREVQKGNEVFIAGSGPSGDWLRQYFPNLNFLEGCPGYPVQYPERGISWLSLLMQWPKWEWTIVKEHRWLLKQHQLHQFDEVISDNRFGIYLSSVHSVFITHQVQPIMPGWMRGIYQQLFWLRMKCFNTLWIPDVAENKLRLSGQMSEVNRKFPVEFIGWLSRFKFSKSSGQYFEYEWVGWVSGPELQRTVFEEHLMQLFLNSGKRCLIISGQPHIKRKFKKDNIELVSHLEDSDMMAVLINAKKIFMRPGYSSLMDLKSIGTRAELVFTPTPGQTEQEYLAKRWSELHV